MNRSTAARIGIAGAVAGAGLAAGGIAMASAGTETADPASSAIAHGPRGDRGQLAEILAEELGIDQDTVEDALEAVRDDLRSERPDTTDGTRPEPPTDAEREERRAALAAALAEELGISEAKVDAALEVVREKAESVREDRRADVREALVERLDAAVEDGTLTEADKASVLKAFDAEILRGGFGGFGGPGGRWGRG